MTRAGDAPLRPDAPRSRVPEYTSSGVCVLVIPIVSMGRMEDPHHVGPALYLPGSPALMEYCSRAHFASTPGPPARSYACDRLRRVSDTQPSHTALPDRRPAAVLTRRNRCRGNPLPWGRIPPLPPASSPLCKGTRRLWALVYQRVKSSTSRRRPLSSLVPHFVVRKTADRHSRREHTAPPPQTHCPLC